MRTMNKAIEFLFQRMAIKTEKETVRVFNKIVHKIPKEEEIDGRDTYKQVMSYLSDQGNEITRKFFWSNAGGTCLFNEVMAVCSSKEELKERLDSADYLSNYFNIDRSKTYNYYSDEVSDKVKKER